MNEDLKPGTPCFLVGLTQFEEWTGRVVVVIGNVPTPSDECGQWFSINAPWAQEIARGSDVISPRRCLKPIVPPEHSTELDGDCSMPTLRAPASLPKPLQNKINDVIITQAQGYFLPTDLPLLVELGRHQLKSDEIAAQLAVADAGDTKHYAQLLRLGAAESKQILSIMRSFRLTIQSRRRGASTKARAAAASAGQRKPWHSRLVTNPGTSDADAVALELQGMGLLRKALDMQSAGEWDQDKARDLHERGLLAEMFTP